MVEQINDNLNGQQIAGLSVIFLNQIFEIWMVTSPGVPGSPCNPTSPLSPLAPHVVDSYIQVQIGYSYQYAFGWLEKCHIQYVQDTATMSEPMY